jgi:hypothetical protein
MLKFRSLATLGLAAVLAGALSAAEPLKSGPQVNEELAGPFHPLNINGAAAGQKHCLYCSNGTNPVAVVFARTVTPELTALVKKIDAATQKNSGASMGSFVVFCSDEDGLQKKLEGVAKETGLKSCVLSIDNPAGPKGYKIAKDADVTVVLYVDRTVKANHTFKKGELNEKAAEKVLADLPKILK